jgi:hypothetical protein
MIKQQIESNHQQAREGIMDWKAASVLSLGLILAALIYSSENPGTAAAGGNGNDALYSLEKTGGGEVWHAYNGKVRRCSSQQTENKHVCNDWK